MPMRRVWVLALALLAACGANTGATMDSGPSATADATADAAPDDAERPKDAARADDAESLSDAGFALDGEPASDSGGATDAGDADGGAPADAGAIADAGADGGAPADAGALSEDASSPDATADAGRVPAFVLIGKQRRRAISYDDGRTWTHDESYVDPITGPRRCGDCDHDAYSPSALIVVGGGLLHAMGHGASGTIFRSEDGRTWTTVLSGREVAGLMYGNGKVIGIDRLSQSSLDDGRTWSAPATISFQDADGNRVAHARGGGFGGSGGGAFVMTAGDGPGPDGGARVDMLVSQDDGLSWQRPTLAGGGRVDVCGTGDITDGHSVIAYGRKGSAEVCWSADRGTTWHQSTIPAASLTTKLISTGTELLAWSRGKLHRSPDGDQWTTENTLLTRPDGSTSSTLIFTTVGRSPGGTFVAVQGSYEMQRFYRSEDGVNWTELAAGAFTPGHPVTDIVHAQVSP